MKKSILYLIGGLLLLPCSVMARQMKDIWISMPDSMIAYLDKNKRMEFIDYADMHIKMDVDNLLHGKSIVDTLTADFMKVRLSEASTIEIKRLPYGNDSIICVVKTLKSGNVGESEINFYNQNWKPIDIKVNMPYASEEDKFIMAELNPANSDMVLIQSLLWPSEEEKKKKITEKVQTTIKWQKDIVNYCYR